MLSFFPTIIFAYQISFFSLRWLLLLLWKRILRCLPRSRQKLRGPSCSVADRNLDTILNNQLCYILGFERKFTDVLRKGLFDFSGKRSEMSYNRSLIESWNSLVSRSTTQSEDLYIILANMLDYNSYHVARLPSSAARMKAMLWSSHKLPLSLLFTSGRRYTSPHNGLDRWVPVEVKGGLLHQQPYMQINGDCLETQTDAVINQSLYILPPAKLDGEYMLTDVEGKVIGIIEVHRSDGDCFEVENGRFEATAILLEQDIHEHTQKIRGACVHITAIEYESSGNSSPVIPISAVYDCPITLTRDIFGYQEQHRSCGLKCISIHNTYDMYKLKIECGKSSDRHD